MLSWRIHSALLSGREDELVEHLAGLGDSAQLVSGHWRELPRPLPCASAALALTTIQDARFVLQGKWEAVPGLYFDARKYDVSYWMPRIDEAIPVLNRRGLFVPAGTLATVPLPLWTQGFPGTNGLIFLRPDSGLKLFSGTVLDCHARKIRNWRDLAAVFHKVVGGVQKEALLCIAPGVRLKPLEWRFWIVDRKVVASTPYSWDKEDIPWQSPPAEALYLAQEVAANEWQPDIAYVVDVVQVAMGDEPFWVNEINAVSTSGLYGVPFDPLIGALREAAMREVAGELTITD